MLDERMTRMTNPCVYAVECTPGSSNGWNALPAGASKVRIVFHVNEEMSEAVLSCENLTNLHEIAMSYEILTTFG